MLWRKPTWSCDLEVSAKSSYTSTYAHHLVEPAIDVEGSRMDATLKKAHIQA